MLTQAENIVKNTSLFVELGGGIRSMETVDKTEDEKTADIEDNTGRIDAQKHRKDQEQARALHSGHPFAGVVRGNFPF